MVAPVIERQKTVREKIVESMIFQWLKHLPAIIEDWVWLGVKVLIIISLVATVACLVWYTIDEVVERNRNEERRQTEVMEDCRQKYYENKCYEAEIPPLAVDFCS